MSNFTVPRRSCYSHLTTNLNAWKVHWEAFHEVDDKTPSPFPFSHKHVEGTCQVIRQIETNIHSFRKLKAQHRKKNNNLKNNYLAMTMVFQDGTMPARDCFILKNQAWH